MWKFVAASLSGAFILGSLMATTAFGATAVKTLSHEITVQAAEAAITMCKSEGYHITVSVVDREGVTRLLMVGDGAGPISIITSRRKAYTSAALGVSTGDIARQQPSPNQALAMIDPEILPLPGGLPIQSDGDVIGAIGVGGADMPAKDEACAQAGVDKIKSQLN